MERETFVVETTFSVRYAKTDAMGIVNHAAYILWFEEGRSAWFRERLGDPRGYALIEDEGYFLMVTDVSARYVASARFGDRIRVRTWISAVRSRGFTVSYRITNADTGTLLTKGRTTHVCVNQHGRVVPIPPHWSAKLLS
ncbi:MAG: acyl-CoA thioesterase [Anaerolineae bacterium]